MQQQRCSIACEAVFVAVWRFSSGPVSEVRRRCEFCRLCLLWRDLIGGKRAITARRLMDRDLARQILVRQVTGVLIVSVEVQKLGEEFLALLGEAEMSLNGGCVILEADAFEVAGDRKVQGRGRSLTLFLRSLDPLHPV